MDRTMNEGGPVEGGPMEGGMGAPIRHPLAWQDPAFYDPAAIDAEMRRVFDICHGCRRCFNLCDSFPRLFDLIDRSDSGELDSVSSDGFAAVEEACTLCDMCFMTKCPYVPPHAFDLDFPHLMLRYRAARASRGEGGKIPVQLARMDRNARWGRRLSRLMNWLTDRGTRWTRRLMEFIAGIDAGADLPRFSARTFVMQARRPPSVAADGPARSRKAVIYASCYVNYHRPETGMAALKVLARQGVETRVVYPGCCGMPFLEQGHLKTVAERAQKVAAALRPWIDEGYDILTLTASCGLMVKFEWPLILPDNDDVRALSRAACDIDEYVVDIARTHGLADGMAPLEEKVALHHACHARAQNMGPKSADMLALIPDIDLTRVVRCAGHGGTFGVMKRTRPIARKVGRPTVKALAKSGAGVIASGCPLAAQHLARGLTDSGADNAVRTAHPIELLADAYGAGH